MFAVAMAILFMIPKYSETVLIWLGVITLIYLVGYALVTLLLLVTAGVLLYWDKKERLKTEKELEKEFKDNDSESEKLNNDN